MKLLRLDGDPFAVAVDGQIRLLERRVCHGYQCCCVCPECLARAERPGAVPAPRQPWESAA